MPLIDRIAAPDLRGRLAAVVLTTIAWWALAAQRAHAQQGHGGGGGGHGGGGAGGTGGGVSAAAAIGIAASIILVLGGIVTAIMIDARRNAPGAGRPPAKPARPKPKGPVRPAGRRADVAARSRTARAHKAP